jgi:hypothetical protein
MLFNVNVARKVLQGNILQQFFMPLNSGPWTLLSLGGIAVELRIVMILCRTKVLIYLKIKQEFYFLIIRNWILYSFVMIGV